MTDEEYMRGWLRDLEHGMENIQQAIYGDKKAPPNGGGVYGELRRIRDEIKSEAQNRKAERAELDGRLDDLEERMRAEEERRDRLFLWGGVGIGLGLVLQALQILGLV